MYFADDTTLISRNVPSLLQQLELVQVYCQGSGAKLNQSKCVVFALNKNAPLPTVPGYYVLPDGETVKFLGVMFGRHDTTAQVIETLDEKLYKSLVIWHRRAWTFENRKLLANSVISSTLWHVALHFNIDQTKTISDDGKRQSTSTLCMVTNKTASPSCNLYQPDFCTKTESTRVSSSHRYKRYSDNSA